MDVPVIADLMLYNIEVAQTFSSQWYIKQDSFYRSMLTSFIQVLEFVDKNGFLSEFEKRILGVINEAKEQRWINHQSFTRAFENIQNN